MHRAFARFHQSTPPPAQPQHVGSPLQVGEIVLLRRPREWRDVKVQLRAIDRELAVVLISDSLEIVELSWLRRAAR